MSDWVSEIINGLTMFEEKNYLIYIIIGLVIVFIWGFWFV